jgi:hypothetical protein
VQRSAELALRLFVRLVFHGPDGTVWVAALEIAEGVVVAVRSILNPGKLAHLTPG